MPIHTKVNIIPKKINNLTVITFLSKLIPIYFNQIGVKIQLVQNKMRYFPVKTLCVVANGQTPYSPTLFVIKISIPRSSRGTNSNESVLHLNSMI